MSFERETATALDGWHSRRTGTFVTKHRRYIRRALKPTLDELTKTGEIVINTAPDCVIAHLCRELAAKQLVAGAVSASRDGLYPARPNVAALCIVRCHAAAVGLATMR